jgi:hypothetical protein
MCTVRRTVQPESLSEIRCRPAACFIQHVELFHVTTIWLIRLSNTRRLQFEPMLSRICSLAASKCVHQSFLVDCASHVYFLCCGWCRQVEVFISRACILSGAGDGISHCKMRCGGQQHRRLSRGLRRKNSGGIGRIRKKRHRQMHRDVQRRRDVIIPAHKITKCNEYISNSNSSAACQRVLQPRVRLCCGALFLTMIPW